MLEEQPRRRAARLVGEVLLLLVAQLARAVGHLAAVGGDLARRDRRAHRVLVDHRPRDLRDLLQVVRRAGGDRAEHDLLGDAPAEQHRHVVDQLLARLEVAVLVGEVERVPEGVAARHDRDLVRPVDAREQLGAHRVPGLVPGDDPALVLRERAARLHARDDPLDGVVEVGVDQLLAARTGGEDRRLVAQVGEVGAREPGGLARDGARGRRPRPSGLVVVCTRMIASRPTMPGGETRIWRSKRPGRSSAGSSFSIRFDAAITTSEPVEWKPSISTSSWLSVCSRSELLSEPRWAPTASSSSMKMIAVLCLARLAEQAADARRAQAGEHLDERRRRLGEELAPDSSATALASSVLPVPGGPCRRMPFGTCAPSAWKR